MDSTPYLCIPTALRYRQSIGGEAAIIAYSQKLARDAAIRVAEILGTEVLENKTGTLGNCCLSNVRLPLKLEEVAALAKTQDVGKLVNNWFTSSLVRDYNTFIAIVFYGGAWWVRLSGQAYLELADFEWAGGVLKEVCARARKGEFLEPIQAKL